MKKIIVILLILLISSFFIFAEEGDFKDKFKEDYKSAPEAYSVMSDKFKPVNTVMLGMGNSGLALKNNNFALFYNPSSLADKNFSLNVPSVGVTVYHFYDFIKKDSNGESLIDKITKSGEEMDTGELASQILDMVGSQFSALAEVDASVGLSLPFGFGLGVYINDGIYTYSGSVIDRLNASIAVGYGHKINFTDDLNLDLGVSLKYNALMFNQRIKATTLTQAKDGIENIELTLLCGSALPIDFGATLNWKGLSGTLVVSNINSNYKMSIIQQKGVSSIPELSGLKYDDFKLEGKPVIDLGFGYELDSAISLRAALDVVDLTALFNDFNDKDLSKTRLILKHVNAGVEVGLVDTIILRAGLQSGRLNFGASLDLFALRIDCAYFWQEMGKAAGQKGLNGLSIRFNLGYDR